MLIDVNKENCIITFLDREDLKEILKFKIFKVNSKIMIDFKNTNSSSLTSLNNLLDNFELTFF